jgi:ElaB/YqjD/DUF883 family membrane-anchored ribosome-binding protein
MVRLSAETETLLDHVDKAIEVSGALASERARLRAGAEDLLRNMITKRMQRTIINIFEVA